MTVGGAQSAVPFIGIPAGLVGVIQVNYQVPSQVTVGTQPVVVTVGGVASPSVSLRVTQ